MGTGNGEPGTDRFPVPGSLFPPHSLHFDRRSLLFELGLDLGRLVLRDARLHGLRRAVDEVLGFLQTETRQLAYDLDDLDLLRAGLLEVDGELRLLLGGRGRGGFRLRAGDTCLN